MAKYGYLKNPSQKEFVVWGIAPNQNDESILYTKAQTLKEAQNLYTVTQFNSEGQITSKDLHSAGKFEENYRWYV